MELHISIYKAPLISNYAALFELWGSIKLIHLHFISSHFWKPDWHFFFKSATCPWRSRVLRLTEASFPKPDSPWTSPRNESVKLSRRQMIVASYPIQWPPMNMMPDMMKPFITQSLKISVILHSFVRAVLWYICITHVANSVLQRCFLMLHSVINRGAPATVFDSWATSLVSDWQGGGEAWGMQRLIREYGPKTMNIIWYYSDWDNQNMNS